MFASIVKDWRQYWSAWLLTALVFVFALQELRVLFVGFVGYLRDSVGMGSLSLAPVAIGVFALSFLAGIVNRFAGTRNALWITAGGLALLRVAEQFAQSAALDLYLSAAAVALFLMYVPLAVGIARSRSGDAPVHLGLAVLFGIGLDNAIHIAASTLDLSWQSGVVPILVVLVAAIALLLALRNEDDINVVAKDGGWKANLALLALGPWLFLQLQVFENTAFFSSMSGLSTPMAGALLLAGNVAGLYLAAQAVKPMRSWVNVLIAGAISFAALWLLFNWDAPNFLWLFFGQVFSLTLGMFIFVFATKVAGKPGLLRSTVLNGIGHTLFVLLLFIYYASFDIDFGFRAGLLPPVALGLATILVAIAATAKGDQKKQASHSYTLVWTSALLFIAPLLLLPTWKTLSTVAAEPATTTVRVMDYNLHDAVNTDGRVDPEALAQVIEASGADIVGLQEISRGWLIWGGMDMLEWLSQRLDMPYVWGPTADAQWGNAILSRYPIVGYGTFDLPPGDVLLLRGFIVAQIEVAGNRLTVVDTHFSEREGQDDIRANQAATIINTWNGSASTVIMGDLNALPNSEAVANFLNAGFIDISRVLGEQPTYTYYSANPDHQIDYIFVSPDLHFSDFEIPRTTASDHLPLVVTIKFGR